MWSRLQNGARSRTRPCQNQNNRSQHRKRNQNDNGEAGKRTKKFEKKKKEKMFEKNDRVRNRVPTKKMKSFVNVPEWHLILENLRINCYYVFLLRVTWVFLVPYIEIEIFFSLFMPTRHINSDCRDW